MMVMVMAVGRDHPRRQQEHRMLWRPVMQDHPRRREGQLRIAIAPLQDQAENLVVAEAVMAALGGEQM